MSVLNLLSLIGLVVPQASVPPAKTMPTFYRGSHVASVAVDSDWQPLAAERAKYANKRRHHMLQGSNKAWNVIRLKGRAVRPRSVELYSVTNDNSRYVLTALFGSGSGSGLHLKTAAGRVVPSSGSSTGSAKQGTAVDFQLDAATAELLAKTRGLTLHRRPDLGREVSTGFAVSGVAPAMVATVTVTNNGKTPVGVELGGMYRGSGRDNRFTITAALNGNALKDVGRSMHFGGLGTVAVLEPGAVKRYSVDIAKWVEMKAPGTYRLTVAWLMDLVEIDGHRTTHRRAGRWTQKRLSGVVVKSVR